jgi:hypothetical protein
MTSKRPRAGFFLDMPFSEAVERFAGVPIEQIDEGVARSKKKKPPRAKRKVHGGSVLSPKKANVISLKDRKVSRRRRGLA